MKNYINSMMCFIVVMATCMLIISEVNAIHPASNFYRFESLPDSLQLNKRDSSNSDRTFTFIRYFNTNIDISYPTKFVQSETKNLGYAINGINDSLTSIYLIEVVPNTMTIIQDTINLAANERVKDMAHFENDIYILGRDDIYVLNGYYGDSINVSQITYSNKYKVDEIFILNKEKLLMASTYIGHYKENNQVFGSIKLFAYDQHTKCVTDSLSVNIDYGMLYTYNSSTQLLDVKDNRIVLANPVDLTLKIYTESFDEVKEIALPKSTPSSTRDSLRKYFSDEFLYPTKVNSKGRIYRLKESGAFSWERIEKVFFITNDIIGISKTLPGLLETQRQIIHYSQKHDSIVYDEIIDVVNDDLKELAPSSILFASNYNVVNQHALSFYFWEQGEENIFSSIGLFKHNPHKDERIIFLKPNIISIDNEEIELNNYKLKDIDLEIFDHNYLLFTNMYTCLSFYDKNSNMAIIITEETKHYVGRHIIKKDYEQRFPNSTVYFLNKNALLKDININVLYKLN